jgi:hypothetical protein
MDLGQGFAMASPVNAVLGALVATAFWTVLGYALARHVLPKVLAIGAAPVIGWAVFSAATLPILTAIGFSTPAVVFIAVLCLVISGCLSGVRPAADAAPAPAPAMPPWSCAAAAVLALVPAVAIVPKVSADGVHLADPIFDHSKIAIIDAMMRQGLPPVNPIFGEFGAAGRLAYYYLWHFSAAELALPLHLSGWEADIALTWFTAFASLALMMGIAVWLSKRSGAALLVVALAAAASLRATPGLLFGFSGSESFLAMSTGFAGWLFQAAWVPQHLMSASCVVAAMVLLVHYARQQSLVGLATLVLIVAAGFESSSYVGGVTFAIAALVAAPIFFAGIEPVLRVRFAIGLAVAAVLAFGLAVPFVRDQLATVAARGGGTPITIHNFEVLGEMFPETLRRVLDLPAYWLILLPIEFPATFVAGTIALLAGLRGAAAGPERTVTAVFTALAGVGFVASWLLVSTVGDNNDLGLRAALPAMMIVIAAAAAGIMSSSYRTLIAVTAAVGLVLSLPDTVEMIRTNIAGRPAIDSQTFAQAPELWAAVRRYATPSARVANNPLYLQDLTPWPANMSWALLANRSSCFAGRELALAFAPLPPERREAINAQFIRVFAGQGTAGDVDDMAKKFACGVVVVVPQDGAWTNDPFAASADYRLAENRDGRWRIYVRAAAGG